MCFRWLPNEWYAVTRPLACSAAQEITKCGRVIDLPNVLSGPIIPTLLVLLLTLLRPKLLLRSIVFLLLLPVAAALVALPLSAYSEVRFRPNTSQELFF